MEMDFCEYSYFRKCGVFYLNRRFPTFQVLEGIATVLSGLIAAYFLPESLQTASFFTEEERNFAGKVPLMLSLSRQEIDSISYNS